MAKTKKRPSKKVIQEHDSVYFLKIVLFFILGTLWIRVINVEIGAFRNISLPFGLLLGIIFATHEHFQIDRKIEFAVLLVATFISFYLPVGIIL